MFRLFGCGGKKSVTVVEGVADESRKTEGSQSVANQDAPAATIKRDEKIPWRYRLFGRPLKKQCVAASDDKAAKSKKRAKKPHWWNKNRYRVAPAPEDQSPKEQRCSTPQDEVVEFKSEEEEEKRTQVEEDVKRPLVEDEKVLPAVPKEEARDTISATKILRHQHLKCLGFPNPARICYMNSCLQSLLTLVDFVSSISCQELVWSSVSEAALMRSFMDIKRSHFSRDPHHKIRLLSAFKKAVSVWAPEFQDLNEKDAHEFLTAVLGRMRSLGPLLQVTATSMGRAYRCPVVDHLVFKMQYTRTCKRCGAGSIREQEYMDLSLDMIPRRASVEQMLENHLAETELEYKCECGANTSGQRSSFVTLPRVLILHLKRFRFTRSFQLKKVNDPILLLRDMVVPSSQGGACYSLVSTISHCSPSARSGHYICDGVDPDVLQEVPIDRWFTYNDAEVTETTGASVCDQRKKTVYILFYRRQN